MLVHMLRDRDFERRLKETGICDELKKGVPLDILKRKS